MNERSKIYLSVIADYEDQVLVVHTAKTKRSAQKFAVDKMLTLTDKNPSQLFYGYVYDWNERKFIDSAVMIEYNGLVETGVHNLDDIPITEDAIIDRLLNDRTFK